MGSSQSTQHDIPERTYANVHRPTPSPPEFSWSPVMPRTSTTHPKQNTTEVKKPSRLDVNSKYSYAYHSCNVNKNQEYKKYDTLENQLNNSTSSSQSTQHDIPKRTYANVHRPTPSPPEFSWSPVMPRTSTTHPKQNTTEVKKPSRLDVNSKYSYAYHSCIVNKNQKYKKSDTLENQLNNSTKKIEDSPFGNNVINDHKVIKETPAVPVLRKSICNGNLKAITKPPNRLNDLDDFIANWNVWKDQFISFLTLMDENKQKHREWGSYLLNFMGPVGQQILSSLIFDKDDDKKDYVILMRKYNSFYEFNKATKSSNENIYEYIERLKNEAVQNIKNVDETLKEKLSRDMQKLHKERFIALASSMLPRFKFETTFKSLSLAEIAFLWKSCEEFNVDSNKSCTNCGRFHQKDKCPAFGKECNKCKGRNHFSRHCSVLYVNNCNFCGGAHGYKQCPAYGEKCFKCNKLHHFSWKCSREILLKNCRFCDMSHPMDRYKCPARNNLCSICRKHGHYEKKCDEKKNAIK